MLGEPRDGIVPPGERLPGERRLAGRVGVSREAGDFEKAFNDDLLNFPRG
ncbi:hypothetical protein ACFY64_37980 [Streptomyces collinus]